jgi:hypothetical protein
MSELATDPSLASLSQLWGLTLPLGGGGRQAIQRLSGVDKAGFGSSWFLYPWPRDGILREAAWRVVCRWRLVFSPHPLLGRAQACAAVCRSVAGTLAAGVYCPHPPEHCLVSLA